MPEPLRIRQAAVLGSGVMGAAISAHLANAGVPNLLLDVKDPRAPNRVVEAGFQRALASSPPAFYTRRCAELVRLGNFDDDLPLLRDADWIVEAVVEDLAIKQRLYARIAPQLHDRAVLSSNTSGLPVSALAAALPPALRRRFLVTHFFNPPRYLKLLEIVPGPDTDSAVVREMTELGEHALGKGVVPGKDTPNFVANRIGVYALLHAVWTATRDGYSVAEVDALTGPLIGRPKSATYRTADVVGIDTLLQVARNSHRSLPGDPERHVFAPPPWIELMAQKGLLGQKSGAGFYRKNENGTLLTFDPVAGEHRAPAEVEFESLEAARKIADPGERLRALCGAPDRAGLYLWKTVGATLRYAARCVPEISDELIHVDNAMKWGFGWELGPFETWDALGVRASCARMKAEGVELPPLAAALLAGGGDAFYRRGRGTLSAYQPARRRHEPVAEREEVILLQALKERGRRLLHNDEASLVDLGDQVACFEFHTKMNAIGPDLIDLLSASVDLVERELRGLVIGSNAANFSAGANLLMILTALRSGRIGEVRDLVLRFQRASARLRYSRRPVVAAPRGLTLGGGCEFCLAADRVVAAAETCAGLPELAAGVIPAGGGCKELLKRLHQNSPAGADLTPLVGAIFETVAAGKVSTSAAEAREMGLLRAGDRVVMNGDRLLHEAKQEVLAMDRAGYAPETPLQDVRVAGAAGLAVLRAALARRRQQGLLSEYDQVVAGKLAEVLCGGARPAGARVSEDYLLELELEAFLSLCADPRSQARMEHVLKTGKPLRN